MVLASRKTDIQYGLRGLNMVTPDQLVDESETTAGQSPFATNFRLFLPQNDSEPRTSVQSRPGRSFYTQPIGEALSVQNNSSAGASTQSVSHLERHSDSFTAIADGLLTKIAIKIGDNTSTDTVVVELYSGEFDELMATTTIPSGDIPASADYAEARFINAPLIESGSEYTLAVYTLEKNGTGSYTLATTTNAPYAQKSIDGGQSWVAQDYGLNWKVYLSTIGRVTGQGRFITENGIAQTLFAFNDGTQTKIYKVDNEATGAVTAIKTGLSADSTRVRFKVAYDQILIVTGKDDMGKWDGTTYTESTHDADFMVPANVTIFRDRAWYYSEQEPTRLYFSALYPDLEVVDAVNYQYVPDTASTDPITGFTEFQDQLVIFTKNSKWLLLGDDVSTLGLSQSPGGTKGAVSQEAISNGETMLYFWSQDGGAYAYDGAQDKPLSDPIQPLWDDFSDLDTVDSIILNKQWRTYYRRSGDEHHHEAVVLDLRYDEWLRDTDTYTRLPVAWDLEDSQLVEASSKYGALFFAETGYSDLGQPIDFKYWTNYKKYGSGIAKDRVKRFRAVFAAPDREMTVEVGKDADFDNNPRMKDVILEVSGIVYGGGETYGSATATYGRGSRVAQPRVALANRAFNTQYRFEKLIAHTPLRIYGYEALISSGRPR